MFRFTKFGWIRHQHSANLSLQRFSHKPWAGGVVLLLCVIVAMSLANMSWSADAYHALLTTDLSMLIHSHDGTIDFMFPREMNVERFVNDAIMVLFFFVVGLEIKREVLRGELSSFRKSILPVLAALGGMLVPAAIYFALNRGSLTEIGWGIPMATDIAFAIGILSMLGNRVPVSLKIFLMALAIADDLGAILVIALFYGGSINMTCIAIAMVVMAGIYILKRLGETRVAFYLIPAIIVWALFYYSGVHATMSGVVMAMLIPTNPRYSRATLLRQIDEVEQNIIATSSEVGEHAEEHFHEQLRRMSILTRNTIPMSSKLEELLSPYVTFLVMPIFALVNSGVEVDFSNLDIFSYSPELGSVGLGIVCGLVLGKPIGVFAMSWLAIKLRLAEMPSGASWAMLFAVSCLAGIGFTMSIFVDTLAFGSANADIVAQGKIAILIGSFTAALLGVFLIFIFSNNRVKR